MKRILFLGDSLTAGSIGSSYLKLLGDEKELARFRLINAGHNGYTMAGLFGRLTEYLKEEPVPEALVLEGGANDLLLPHMQSSGTHWDPFIRKLGRHGSVPARTEGEFRQESRRILTTAFSAGVRAVFVSTIPFLGENLDSKLNRRREDYNRILHDICDDYRDSHSYCVCIDYDALLKPILRDGSDWLFRKPEDLLKDAEYILEKDEDQLCRDRGLRLSIDGAHLNDRGARLISSEILKAFREHSLII